MAVSENAQDVMDRLSPGSRFHDEVLDVELTVTSVSPSTVVLASPERMYALPKQWLKTGIELGTLSLKDP